MVLKVFCTGDEHAHIYLYIKDSERKFIELCRGKEVIFTFLLEKGK